MPSWVSMPVIYALLAAVVASGGIAVVQTVRLSAAQRDHAEAVAEHERDIADIASQRARLIQEAIEAERQHAKTLARVAERYEQELDAAAVESRELADDLRAGNVRLRKLWQGCETATRVPGAATGSAEPDEDARLREEAAARIIGVGAKCDAHVRALQDALRADRG